jgi:hypothetical protein
MSKTLELIRSLVARGETVVSAHGYDELAADDILVQEVLSSISDAIGIEEYLYRTA